MWQNWIGKTILLLPITNKGYGVFIRERFYEESGRNTKANKECYTRNVKIKIKNKTTKEKE